ncbi:MAG: hypothetical protein ACT4OY_03820 [Alphaproteobacteria bacterium]
MSDEEIKADLVRDRGAITRQTADKQIDEALALAEKLRNPPNFERNRKIFKWGVSGAVVMLLGLGFNYLFAPIQSTMAYGICRVFLERQALYPHTVRISEVEEFETSVRIWYAQINSFGEYRLEQIQCFYRPDPVTGSALERVAINRRDVDPDQVAAFNKTLPAIFKYPPDLTIPDPLPDSLEDLTIETDKFREPILGR